MFWQKLYMTFHTLRCHESKKNNGKKVNKTYETIVVLSNGREG